MSYNVATGQTGQHRFSWAQLGVVALFCNGHDSNGIVDVRTGQAKTLGIAAPGAAPTGASNGAGNLSGSYRWRVRWKDSSTGAFSLASDEYTGTPASHTWRITRPGSPPSRADYWVLERTVESGSVFYPVNVDSSNPHGTAIATTVYDDNVTDGILRNRNAQGFSNNQGQPRNYRFCWSNGPFLFMAGGRVHRPAVTVTNGSAAVTASDGQFTAAMVNNEFLSMDADTDGKTYKIGGYTNANSITLAENYAGTTKTLQPCKIAGKRDLVAWCEPAKAESWGAALPGGLQNELTIGNDGEPLVAGIGLGQAGCLLCKERSMFYHNYRVRPNIVPVGDGQIVRIQAARGACSPRSVVNIAGLVYGCDVYGVWRLSPGGEPEEVGQALANDWKTLNFSEKDNFILDWDPYFRLLYVLVCGPGETYPKRAYLWDLDGERWVGTRTWPYGVTATFRLPDSNGAERLGFFSEAVGSSPSCAWFDGIGASLGAPSSAANLTGSVTGGSSTTLANSGAAWPTTGSKLKGIPVTLIRAADASEETTLISDNTGTSLTVETWAGTAPVAGDTYRIGALEASWKTGRIDCGEPQRKKTFQGVWLRLKYGAAAVPLKLRAYYDGSATPYSYGASRSEDGVAIVSGSSIVTITPQSGKLRYYVPLDGQNKNDVQLEFLSNDPGDAWEVYDAELVYEPDANATPRKD